MTSEERLKQSLYKYQNVDQTYRDILKVRKTYQGLIAKEEQFVFSNGLKKELFNLSGTIPVPYKGKTYHIPVCLWLMDTHPLHAPICFVKPTADMCLKPSMFMDHSGKVYLPYLHNWNSSSSNLVGLIEMMIKAFSDCPPVFAKPKHETTTSTPYPTQAYTGSSPATGVTPYPLNSSYPPYPTAQTNVSSGYQNFGYPPYPPQNNMFSAATPSPAHPSNYPPYPPSPAVSTPYPTSTASNLPYTPFASNQSNLVTSASSPNSTGTITEEHIRASLMSAIEDKIRRKVNEQTVLCQDEVEILLQTQRELNQGKNKLDTMFDNLEKEKQSIEQKIQMLKDKEVELEKTIEKLSSEEDVDVDDAVITTTPLYKQILNTHCEDAATEDTIYYIGEALRRGVIDLDVFIKQLRDLSRKRLMLRSLLEKCRMKAGLAAA